MKLSAAHKAELTAILAGLQKARTPEVDECFDLYFPRPVTGMEGVDFVWVYYSRNHSAEKVAQIIEDLVLDSRNHIFVSRKLDTAPKVERSYQRDRYYEGITVYESHTLRALRSL